MLSSEISNLLFEPRCEEFGLLLNELDPILA